MYNCTPVDKDRENIFTCFTKMDFDSKKNAWNESLFLHTNSRFRYSQWQWQMRNDTKKKKKNHTMEFGSDIATDLFIFFFLGDLLTFDHWNDFPMKFHAKLQQMIDDKWIYMYNRYGQMSHWKKKCLTSFRYIHCSQQGNVTINWPRHVLLVWKKHIFRYIRPDQFTEPTTYFIHAKQQR